MSVARRPPSTAVPLLGVLLGLLMASAVTLHPAAAAQLPVSAAPLQTWTVEDLPEVGRWQPPEGVTPVDRIGQWSSPTSSPPSG